MDRHAPHFTLTAAATAVCIALSAFTATGCGITGAPGAPSNSLAICTQSPSAVPSGGPASVEPGETPAPTETPRADVSEMEISIEGGDWEVPWDETRRVRVTCKLGGELADITGECVYTTSDARILSAGGGMIRGVGSGKADLTATFGGHSVTAKVEVLGAEPKNIWFYDEKVQLPLALYGAGGMRYKMILCSDYDNGKTYDATRQATWRVEDPAVASVSAGAVTALKAGKTTIVAQYGGYTAKTTLTVFGGLPDRLTVDIGNGEASKNAPLVLNVLLGFGAKGEYPAAECVNIYNRSPKIAQVAFKDGKLVVTGVKAGKADLIVSAFGLSKAVTVTVK
jgi:hypothetical protein